MKKEYIYPEMEVVNVQTISTILSGSTGVQNKDADKDNEGFFNDASQWFGSDSEDEEDW